MITKSTLAQIVEKQLKSLDDRPPGQPRAQLAAMPYLTDEALLLGGVRGSGRSTLLLQMMRAEYPQAWYTDFADPRLAGFDGGDFARLTALIAESGRGVVLLDKVDENPGWLPFVGDLLDKGAKVVATVSLDTLLAVEAGRRSERSGPPEGGAARKKLPGRRPASATAAGGRPLSVTGSGLRTKRDGIGRMGGEEVFRAWCDRLVTVRVAPFGYVEFLEAARKRGGESGVAEYMQRGGFPELLKSPRPEAAHALYESILTRDVLLAKGVRDRTTLCRIALQLFSANGHKVTANALRNQLKIKAVSTVAEHMEHLERAGLFSYLPLWSDNPARQYVNPRRVFAVDTALVAALTLKKEPEREMLFANVIHNHLRARYEALCYLDGDEVCDFVALEEGRPALCVQICYDVEDAETMPEKAEALLRARARTGAVRGMLVTPALADRVEVDEIEVEVVDADTFLSE